MKYPLSFVNGSELQKVSVFCNEPKNYKLLRKIGFRRPFSIFYSSEFWHLKYKDEDQLAAIYISLRNAGFYFTYDQHGFGADSDFERLRKKGKIFGHYVQISWAGPKKIYIRKIEENQSFMEPIPYTILHNDE